MRHESFDNDLQREPTASHDLASSHAGGVSVDCSDVAALLSGLIDDVVDARTRHLAERHIATCTACAAMLDRAEKLDGLLGDALTMEAELPLPAGFAEAVFAETTRVRPHMAPSLSFKARWFAVSGWLAAAASLTFAVVLYVVGQRPVQAPVTGSGSLTATNTSTSGDVTDHQGATRTLTAPNSSARSHYRLGAEAISGVYDGYRPPVTMKESGDPARGNQVVSMSSDSSAHESDDENVLVKDRWGVFPVSVGRVAERPAAAGAPRLTRADGETLYQVAQLLERVVNADERSMSDIETVRQIAEYDRVLDKLDGVLDRLDPRDRTFVQAAVPIINQIVHGPMSEADVREMRGAIAARDLIGRIDRLSGRVNPDHSM